MIKTCNHLQRFGVKDLNMHSVDQHEVKELLVCITAMESHRICHLPSLQVPVLRQLHFVPIALCNKHGHKSAALSTRERQHFSTTVLSGRENSCICGSQSRKKHMKTEMRPNRYQCSHLKSVCGTDFANGERLHLSANSGIQV